MSTTRHQYLQTVIAYGRRSDADRLRFALAAAAIVTAGTTQAALVAEVKAADPHTLITGKTLSLALRSLREAVAAADGAPVTAEGYGEAFRAVNRESAGRTPRTPRAATPGVTVTAETTPEQVLAALALIRDVLPTFTPDQQGAIRAAMRSILAGQPVAIAA